MLRPRHVLPPSVSPPKLGGRYRGGRRGIILLVVVAVLTLFAVVGLSFVLYADAEATSARLFREAQSQSRPDMEPELLLAYFLGQLIYDVADDETGVSSALRGHSLARLLYGYKDGVGNTNRKPFTGTGRLHAPSPFPGIDDYDLINYTYFPADGFVRDPERLGPRTSLAQPRGPFTGGFHAPYTYPDLNNLFLAAVKADGTVLIPSFHRPWTGFGALDPNNPNWYDTTKPWLKYQVLRPRPADMGPGFPAPEDAGGDVKNLIGSPGGNDSIWLDLGAPVRTAPDGRKYKPLFAPLIVDLDSRVNVNVHGNVRGQDPQGRPAHLSNQGWGPWEVNLQPVLGKQLARGAYEWPNLVLGTARPPQLGRSGPNQQPDPAPLGQPAGDDRLFALSSLEALLRYGDTGSPALTSELFRLCPQNFGDPSDPLGSARRRRLVTTHSFDVDKPGVTPWVYNLLANNPNRYPLSSPDPTQAPLGSPIPFPPLPWRTAPPPGFHEPPPVSEFAPDWRAKVPGYSWWWGGGSGRIGLNRPLPPFPHQGSGLTPPFGPPLVTDPNGRFDDGGPIQAQFQVALTARQQLADDIYRQLLAVTGVPPPVNPAAPTDAELQPRRWLAQLAVNIVDYIDEDDISTPSTFYTEADAYPQGPRPGDPPFDLGAVSRPDSNGNGHLQPGEIQWPRYWVFGTELPHVVVNEALAETHDATVTPTPRLERIRVFVEPHNPFPAAGSPTLQQADRRPVPLQVAALPGGGPSPSGGTAGAYTPYRVVLAVQPLPGLIASGPHNDNVLGNPDQVRAATNEADFTNPVLTITGAPQPLGTGPTPTQPTPSPYIPAQPQGFLLLGPPAVPAGPDPQDFRARDPFQPPNTAAIPPNTPLLRTGNLEYRQPFPAGATNDERTTGVTVLLRRLVNPHLPFNPQRSRPITDPRGTGIRYDPNPWYNPYVTVDYLERIPLWPTKEVTAVFASRGKRQPYASDRSQVADQLAALTSQAISATFGRPNQPPPNLPNGHYDWLVHLDRQLISPMELLQVSGYQPHQLTHQFLSQDDTGQVQKFSHRVPWFDQRNRLYRVFEFLEAHNHAEAVLTYGNGRIPGRINLNTIWDPEILWALCDPQPANSFTLADVENIFGQLLALRTPDGAPGPNDRPFLSLATGYTLPGDRQYPRGSGLEDTLLRSFNGGARRLFQPALPPSASPDHPARHPYLRDQLLTKIFNHLTTRSHVFAVWVTVGFFAVTDETTRPVQLGAESGRSENRHIRHRLFAIVDRSTLDFNSGPQEWFNPRADAALVPYFSIID